MAPKQLKSDATSPDVLGEISGGAIDRSHSVAEKLGSIQQSITYLEGFADDFRKELRVVSERMTSAEATFRTLKWVLGIAGTLLVLLWTFIASIVTLAVKHYLGW